MTRLLVCGGRKYDDQAFLFAVLDCFHRVRPISCIIHGAAKGADSLADDWAIRRGVSTDPYPVTRKEWDQLGLRAGAIRNEKMLVQGRPDACIAFPGGRGTADMCSRVRDAGILLIRYRPPSWWDQ